MRAPIASRLSSAYVLLPFAALCWAGNHIIARWVAGHTPPIGLNSLRWSIATLLLLPLARVHLKNDWLALRGKLPLMLFYSLGGGALFSTLQFMALSHTVALNAAVMNSAVPVLMLAVSWLVFGDRLSRLQLGGILVSVTGVLVIIAKGDAATFTRLSFNLGDLLLLLNMSLFAVYSSCLRLRPRVHPLSFLFAVSLISAVISLPFWLGEHLAGNPLPLDFKTLVAIGYTAIFTSVLAYIAWNRGVEQIGPARAGAFLHLVPLYGILLATTLLGETLQLFHLAGMALILAGVWLVARR